MRLLVAVRRRDDVAAGVAVDERIELLLRIEPSDEGPHDHGQRQRIGPMDQTDLVQRRRHMAPHFFFSGRQLRRWRRDLARNIAGH